jgi:hypothetical protein
MRARLRCSCALRLRSLKVFRLASAWVALQPIGDDHGARVLTLLPLKRRQLPRSVAARASAARASFSSPRTTRLADALISRSSWASCLPIRWDAACSGAVDGRDLSLLP